MLDMEAITTESNSKSPAVLFLGFMLLCFCILQPVHAHLMVAQHGTLNIIDDEIYMVLSLPISGFERIDNDEDGKVTMIEFNHQREAITRQINQGVMLSDSQQSFSLESLLLSPVADHHDKTQSLTQLIIMGKYTIKNATDKLIFHVDIYGKDSGEKNIEVTAKRDAKRQKHTFELTPKASSAILFNSF
ncbi:hypothetical protein [Aliiglaciecola aliphaticivorans]